MSEFNFEDAGLFSVGQTITVTPRPRWYVRLWRWALSKLRRRSAPALLVVVAVDRDAGVITLGQELES